ncbi:alpha-tubulin suppressor protein aats1 [Stemphylium lycopersici]|uniref:Alpha-tubulin suppressor protein aats1 n=1 Tax=Stemphylium lycopersici TaxID=183478 RepID=A0A364NG47_STELY|nr:alpha-tubulin suppressor protein aats1 [Stemphylium lycopersici]RAR03799.1 alpha-tubulin suppressor protein aats1 [Stemphylium lycopersici]RAR16207.1 alpha-tubulin suppressor protein aats1 [Stemphylium lycopersici]
MPRQLYVFGSNGEGQLGIPAAEIVNVPTKASDTPPLDNIVAIQGGDNHTLFLYRNGSVYGVGDNRKGQLGSVGKEPQIPVFKKAYDDASFTAASCESSAHIRRSESAQGFVYTEGTGQWGELGRGEEVSQGGLSSIDLPLPGRVIDFAAGVWHYVAILEDGSVYGWGKARLGQLGNGLTGKVTVPTKIDDIPFKPIKVVCGKDFTYLIGDPSSGEHMLLGKDKFNIISNKPQNIKGWKDIGATWHAIFVRFSDGTLTAWGKENMWRLMPPNLPLLDKIAVGSDHVLAFTADGKLISWGWGKHGNCGDLTAIKCEMKNDMVSGFWNDIDIPGEVETIGAGFCTSFVVVR